MPLDAATITSAVATQAATPPLRSFGTVSFNDGADSSPAMQLGAEKFGFTGAILFVHRPATRATPGLVAGEIEYTDILDRKATVLYRAEFTKAGDLYTVTKLDVSRSYKDKPRIDVTVVLAKDLQNTPLKSYAELLKFLGDKGLTPVEFANSGIQDFTIFAVGKDWAKPEATMTIAISAQQTGITGYKKTSEAFNVEGWPVAVASGRLNPADTKDKLFAKVIFKQGNNLLSASRYLGAYKLSAFDK